MKFVLYNHIGSGNHGCEALVRTISILLGKKNVELLSDNPNEDNEYGITEEIVVKSSVSNYKKCSFRYLYSYLMLKLKNNYFYMDILPYLKSIKLLNKNDVLVSIGGDIFCYENYPKYNLMHKYALKFVKKSILLGCSIEPGSLKDKHLLSDLKSFDLITAREHITYNALKNNGIDHVVYCPDSAFMLEMEETELPNNFLINKTVGLNISPLVLNKSKDKNLILNNYRKLIEYVLNNTDYIIALVPHVVWKNNDDREPLKILYNEYKNTNRICMVEDQNAKRLKFIISKCAFFVGARTHATIAAYSTCVPTLVLGYSVKSIGIARDLFESEDNYVLSYKDITKDNDLCEKFQWIEKNEKEIKEILENKNKQYMDILENVRERLFL